MAVTFKKIICEEVANLEDHYDVELVIYKGSLKGRFERSQIRHLIEVLDNSINVGVDQEVPILSVPEVEQLIEEVQDGEEVHEE